MIVSMGSQTEGVACKAGDDDREWYACQTSKPSILCQKSIRAGVWTASDSVDNQPYWIDSKLA